MNHPNPFHNQQGSKVSEEQRNGMRHRNHDLINAYEHFKARINESIQQFQQQLYDGDNHRKANPNDMLQFQGYEGEEDQERMELNQGNRAEGNPIVHGRFHMGRNVVVQNNKPFTMITPDGVIMWSSPDGKMRKISADGSATVIDENGLITSYNPENN